MTTTNSMPFAQIERIILKGNMSTALTNLNKTSMDSPTILNGNSSNHTKGNRIRIKRAIGQHAIKRNAHNIKAMNVLIRGFWLLSLPNTCHPCKTLRIKNLSKSYLLGLSGSIHRVYTGVHERILTAVCG
jgi:hypothetical protein